MTDGGRHDGLIFDRLTTAHLSDVSPYGVVMSPSIRSMWEGATVSGPAFTVRVAPGDNASLQAAIADAPEGSVIVCDGGGYLERSLWGAIMSRAAQIRGIAGLVVDGAVRDRDEIRGIGFPVFAAGCTPIGPYNKVPGSLRQAVVCGGVTVSLDDMVYGDGDGVVVVPKADHAATNDRAEDRMRREAAIVAGLEEGRPLAELLGMLRTEAKP